MNIVVSNLNKKHRINANYIKKIIVNILNILKKPSNTKLEIVFLSDRAIKPINRRYKGEKRATDVLSFDLGLCKEILISSDTALRNSRVYNTSFEKELILYVVHGILHLFGYDDERSKDRSKMFGKQKFIMEILCAKVRLPKVLTRR